MSEYENVIYEVLEGGVARVRMNRSEVRNAQSRRLTYERPAGRFHAAAFNLQHVGHASSRERWLAKYIEDAGMETPKRGG